MHPMQQQPIDPRRGPSLEPSASHALEPLHEEVEVLETDRPLGSLLRPEASQGPHSAWCEASGYSGRHPRAGAPSHAGVHAGAGTALRGKIGPRAFRRFYNLEVPIECGKESRPGHGQGKGPRGAHPEGPLRASPHRPQSTPQQLPQLKANKIVGQFGPVCCSRQRRSIKAGGMHA